MTALAVVEDLEVLEHRVRELDPGAPLLAVEKLDLHPGPERLDDGIVEGVTDGTHRESRPPRHAPCRTSSPRRARSLPTPPPDHNPAPRDIHPRPRKPS